MSAPPLIADLVERFDQQSDAYKSGQYNEAQLRQEFIDPMFKALGWDMENVSGYAEAYKDVIHEDAIKIGGATKAPDYCFRIGGTRKFFLEAKKPSVDIKTDADPRPLHLIDDSRVVCGSRRPLLNTTSRSHSISPASLQN